MSQVTITISQDLYDRLLTAARAKNMPIEDVIALAVPKPAPSRPEPHPAHFRDFNYPPDGPTTYGRDHR